MLAMAASMAVARAKAAWLRRLGARTLRHVGDEAARRQWPRRIFARSTRRGPASPEGRAVGPGDVDMGVEGEQAAVQRERIGHAVTVVARRAGVKCRKARALPWTRRRA